MPLRSRISRRPLVLPLGTPPLISLNAATANGTGTAYNLGHAFSNWEVQIVTTGSPAAFSVQLQGCEDGLTFQNIGSAITTAGLTSVTSNTPLTTVQCVLSGLSGGTNPTITAVIVATEAPAGAGGGGGGTVTQGTAAATAGAWPVKVTDGTNVTAVKAASTAAVATDPSAVVALSPNSPLPAGSNALGSVTVTGTTTVSGTVNAAQSGTWTVQPGNTANTTAWKVDNSGVTQPVSGTVTGNQGTANSAANGWPVKVTDGTNTAAVKAASTAAGATDPAAVVSLSPNSPLPTGSNALGSVTVTGTTTVSGTVTANQGGTWTVQPGNTANTTAWKVDGSAVTQPVSGTVTSNQGTANTAANAWPAKLTDGTNVTAVKAASTAAAAADPSAVVALSPNSALPAGSNALGSVTVTGTSAVSGTVTANQGTNVGSGTGAWNVQGAAAVGAAVTGNPVPAALSDPSGNAQYWKQAVNSTGSIANGVGVGAVGLYVSNGGTAWTPIATGGSIADANGGVLALPVCQWAYNGATFDRLRNNVDVTLLASAARTTTQTSADIVTYNCQAVVFTLDVTAVPGSAPSLVVTINYKDPASGKYITLLTGVAVTAVGTTTYAVDPRLVAGTEPYTKTVPAALGRTFQIVITAGNGNSATYSAGYTLGPG